jgi:hypothetical protein
MIIANLIGGLGNQMFQYATGRAVAHRHGVPLLLDASGFAHYDLRRYELGELAIQARLATDEELAKAGVKSAEPTLLNRVKKSLGLDRPANQLKEASFTYDARIEQATPPVYLDGYWQSERYFANIADLLRQEFMLKEPADAANAAIAARIAEAGAGAVSLHIRRGDYVSNAQTSQYHGVCSLDYYRAAVEHVSTRVAAPHFFVFSDDHAWVSENFKMSQPVTLVDVNGADRGVWDMALMKACRHHIIANSSFSWWGAWLNPHADKVVVAPERWFSGASHDTTDLVPASWTRL